MGLTTEPFPHERKEILRRQGGDSSRTADLRHLISIWVPESHSIRILAQR